MTGVAKRLERGEIEDLDQFRRQYKALLSNNKYTASIEKGTSDEANVVARMRLAEDAFADVT